MVLIGRIGRTAHHVNLYVQKIDSDNKELAVIVPFLIDQSQVSFKVKMFQQIGQFEDLDILRRQVDAKFFIEFSITSPDKDAKKDDVYFPIEAREDFNAIIDYHSKLLLGESQRENTPWSSFEISLLIFFLIFYKSSDNQTMAGLSKILNRSIGECTKAGKDISPGATYFNRDDIAGPVAQCITNHVTAASFMETDILETEKFIVGAAGVSNRTGAGSANTEIHRPSSTPITKNELLFRIGRTYPGEYICNSFLDSPGNFFIINRTERSDKKDMVDWVYVINCLAKSCPFSDIYQVISDKKIIPSPSRNIDCRGLEETDYKRTVGHYFINACIQDSLLSRINRPSS